MAVRHINPNAKEESGIFVSGKEAEKVFSMFFDVKSEEDIKQKQENLHSQFQKAMQSAKKLSK